MFGAYANHPAFGASPVNQEMFSKIPPNKKAHKLNAFNLGKATSLAPIIEGTIQLKNAALNGITTRNIIVVPCIVNTWLYTSGVKKLPSGPDNCILIRRASIPPTRNQKNAITPYIVPIFL